jgi:uncharacterized membrane protein
LTPAASKNASLQQAASLSLGWTWWTLLPFALVAAAIAVPYLLPHGLPGVALALRHGFALVCHQRPERSLWLFGGTVAVCARCLGIYLGAAIGLLLRCSRRIALGLLALAAAANLADALTEVLGLHSNWLAVRFALGIFLGVTAALLVSSARDRFGGPPRCVGDAGNHFGSDGFGWL